MGIVLAGDFINIISIYLSYNKNVNLDFYAAFNMLHPLYIINVYLQYEAVNSFFRNAAMEFKSSTFWR